MGAAPAMETKADLVALANKLNPVVGFWDPMNLCEYDQWSQGEEAAIGFLRHSEIKHGRIAMFGFVGYIVQSNGIHWPWNIESSGLSFGDLSAAGSPPEQWDALSTAAKIQFFGVIAFLELIGENSYALEQSGEKHYMRGGKPGFYPSLKKVVPHPVPLTSSTPSACLPRPRRRRRRRACSPRSTTAASPCSASWPSSPSRKSPAPCPRSALWASSPTRAR